MNALGAVVILPLALAVLSTLWRQSHPLRRILLVLALVFEVFLCLHLLVLTQTQGIQVLNLGGWAAPYGIALVVDGLSAIMMTLASFVTLMTVIYRFLEVHVNEGHPLWTPLVCFLLAGMNLSFVTGDLFNLFVAFEVLLISSYSLMSLEADKWGIKQVLPYVLINIVGSTLFLIAASYCYGILGTLNFAEIALRSNEFVQDSRFLIFVILMSSVFAIKSGLFPLSYWLPRSYPTLPTPLAALFAAMLTKVGVYCFLRFYGTVIPHQIFLSHHLILILAVPTMLFSVMAALSAKTWRGIFSWHVLSQVGFLLMAVGFGTKAAFAACLFYIIHHIIVKSSLFFVGGIIETTTGHDEIRSLKGLWHQLPFVAFLFLLQALSYAGIPPFSGFWGKFTVLWEGVHLGKNTYVFLALLSGLLTLVSMIQILRRVFWKEGGEAKPSLMTPKAWALTSVVIVLTLVSLSIAIYPDFYFGIVDVSADQFWDRDGYIQSILGVKP